MIRRTRERRAWFIAGAVILLALAWLLWSYGHPTIVYQAHGMPPDVVAATKQRLTEFGEATNGLVADSSYGSDDIVAVRCLGPRNAPLVTIWSNPGGSVSLFVAADARRRAPAAVPMIDALESQFLRAGAVREVPGRMELSVVDRFVAQHRDGMNLGPCP